jgi:hypothetical protein
MVRRFRHWGGFAPAALALLLLFRLLIPSGFMIAPDQEGRPGLVLCSAPAQAAAETAQHPGHDGHPDDPAPSKPGEIPCPFAALAAPPLQPEPPAVEPKVRAVAVPPELPANPGFPRVAPASPPPPARGPPIPV